MVPSTLRRVAPFAARYSSSLRSASSGRKTPVLAAPMRRASATASSASRIASSARRSRNADRIRSRRSRKATISSWKRAKFRRVA